MSWDMLSRPKPSIHPQTYKIKLVIFFIRP